MICVVRKNDMGRYKHKAGGVLLSRVVKENLSQEMLFGLNSK